MDNMIYITIDGDGIGQQVGRAVLSDDEAGLVEMSKIINGAQQFMAHAIKSMGGVVIELGGDEITGKIPPEALDHVEAMRKDVQNSFGFTITVGIGSKLSEAAKSLLVGKTNGKDQTVMFGPEVEDQLRAVSDRMANGEGTEEDEKIPESYLAPKEGDMKHDHEHSEDDCEYCQEAEGQQGNGDEGEMGEEQVDDHEHSGDDCEYCREAEGQEGGNPDEVGEEQIEGEAPHEHEDGESCEYCDQMGDEANSGEQDFNEQAPEGVMGQDDQLEDEAVAGNQEAQDEHTEEGMKQIASAIESEEGGGQDNMAGIDSEDMAVGTNMVDGVSRPDDYADDGDKMMGLSEDDADEDQGPDLGGVLKDGLDSHAENIQKEKVSQMVGEALEGFKANKKVLEMAKEQAPDFYQCNIMMLKAMIEMAKMLGFSEDEQVPGDDGSETEGQLESDEQAPHPDYPAPPVPPGSGDPQQEGSAPPKPKGQSAKA